MAEKTCLESCNLLVARRVLLVISGCFFVIQSLAFAQQSSRHQKLPTSEQVEAASLIDAHLINLEAISEFDVMIETSDVTMIDGAPVLEVISLERWIHDSDKKFDLYTRTATRHDVDVKDTSNPIGDVDVAYGFGMQKDGYLFIGSVPGRIRSAAIQNASIKFGEILATPCFQMVGIERFPAPNSIPENIRKGTLHSYRTPQALHSLAQNADGKVAVYITDPLNTDIEWPIRRKYLFDPLHNLIVSYNSSFQKRGKTGWKRDVSEEIVWREFNSIFVPSMCYGEHLKNIRTPTGEIVEELHAYEAKIKWRAVDDELVSESGNLSTVSTLQWLHEFLDPNKFTDQSTILP